MRRLATFRTTLAQGGLGCAAVTWLVAAGLNVPRAAGHDDHPDEAASEFTEADQHRPTPLPDRLVLTWSGDPATTMDVTWRTSAAAGEPVVEFAAADSLRGSLASGEVAHAQRAAGTSAAFASNLGECLIHTARMAPLAPDTLYAYRVGDGAFWSEWFQFRTASREPRPFTFVYFGDAQNAVRSMWSRVVRESNQYAPRAAFMLHAGDLINHGNSDGEWGEWFGAGSWLNGMIPCVATPGNHEYSGELSGHWRPQFSFPLNGPPGLEETVYWFDYQGARIISLNSNEQIDQQVAWLRGVLTDPQRPKWTIATFHHPIFSAAKSRDNPALRKAWRPLLEEHGVDLVLQGHDHAYNRSGLGGPSNVNVAEGERQTGSNTVYVVSVSGPKMYPLQEEWDVSRVASGVQLFQVIRVAPERVQYEARLATGELYDAFTLEKEGGGRTVLTEQVPPTPAIRE